MTHDEIDTLTGRKLDAAFMEAFQAECIWKYHKATDRALAALPETWHVMVMGLCRFDRDCWGANVFRECDKPIYNAIGPTPATALCRAAIKAKVEERCG